MAQITAIPYLFCVINYIYIYDEIHGVDYRDKRLQRRRELYMMKRDHKMPAEQRDREPMKRGPLYT